MSDLPIAFNKGYSDADRVTCPVCEGEYLHHSTVNVFDREEDSNDVKILSNGSKTVSGHENPSLRRNGLTVAFECETCRSLSVLALVQHKGSSYVYWQESSEHKSYNEDFTSN